MAGNHQRACKIKTLLNSVNLQDNKHIKKKIKQILSKHKSEYTVEEKNILKKYKHVVKLLNSQQRYQIVRKQRELELEDDTCIFKRKCLQLINLIQSSQYVVIYTGAGISTSASIPDYRGPNGVWTQLRNGFNTPKVQDLVLAEPTYTHLAISKLVQKGIVKYVVSQNCDGLHIRSGLSHRSLSEIHGNMFIEVCKNCQTPYMRSFDVTEKTSLRRHETGRKCHSCPPEMGILIDTIVHFGEKGKLKYPLRWEAATEASENADLIICLGSSLKILKGYKCLWPNKKQCKLVIVNLQWTPKDSHAIIKINAKCDDVMREIMSSLDLSIDQYERSQDPIYSLNFSLKPEEEITCNRIKLDELVVNQFDKSKVALTPGWFGKGMKRK